MDLLKKNHGYTSILSIVVLTILGLMGSSIVNMSSTGVRMKGQEVQTSQAVYVGNAGIQYALLKLKNGLNPNNVTKTIGAGEFTITTNPTIQEVAVSSSVGESQKSQKLQTAFTAQCLEIDPTPHVIENNNALKQIRVRKTCHAAAILTAIKLSWTNGGANNIDEIEMGPSSIHGPGGIGSMNATIDTVDSSLTNGNWVNLNFYFDDPIVIPNNYTLTLIFMDESSTTSNFSL